MSNSSLKPFKQQYWKAIHNTSLQITTWLPRGKGFEHVASGAHHDLMNYTSLEALCRQENAAPIPVDNCKAADGSVSATVHRILRGIKRSTTQETSIKRNKKEVILPTTQWFCATKSTGSKTHVMFRTLRFLSFNDRSFLGSCAWWDSDITFFITCETGCFFYSFLIICSEQNHLSHNIGKINSSKGTQACSGHHGHQHPPHCHLHQSSSGHHHHHHLLALPHCFIAIFIFDISIILFLLGSPAQEREVQRSID